MNIGQIRENAWAMPVTSPSYPKGPYRFFNREFLVITYRTDPAKLRAVVPEPLTIEEPLVNYEFIRMPDSTGFGDYTESGQVIPVSHNGVAGNYTHAMYLNDHPATAGGRELWGFPKKIATAHLETFSDTLVGTLDYGPLRVATGTMGYKHQPLDAEALGRSLAKTPNYLLKVMPHVDGSARVCELVRFYLQNIQMKGAWSGPAALEFAAHARAPVAELPVLEVVGAKHFVADLTLGLGEVVFDYLE